VQSYINKIIFVLFQVKIFIFAPATVLIFLIGKKIKREPGENPGQSRCCKLFQILHKTQATGKKGAVHKIFVMAGLTRHPLKVVKHQYSKFIAI
jgi:hypothetical protein